MSLARVVVIGGGITGLAAAWTLQTASPELEVVLLEASDRLGGWIHTERRGEVIVEHGPDSWVASKPAATALARDLGLADQLIGLRMDRASVGIVHQGRIEPLPDGLWLMVPTALRPLVTTRLLSVRGKVRVLAELFVPPRVGSEDESLGSFVRRRFGPEFYERIVEPLLSGVYGSDPDRLSLLATYPVFRDFEERYGSLLRTILARPRPRSPGPPFLSLRDGMGSLVEALVRQSRPGMLRTCCAVRELHPCGCGWRVVLHSGEVLDCDAVVSAVPAEGAAELVKAFAPDVASQLRAIPYQSSAAVTLVYDRKDVEPFARGRGILVPAREGRAISAVTWVTNKFAYRAPEHLAIARVFFRGPRAPDGGTGSPEGLVAAALRELRLVVGLWAEPIQAIVSWHPKALPQYLVGHRDRVATIRQSLTRWPTLRLAGAAFDGVGVPDCIASGQQAAHQVLQCLGLDSP